jgi:GAF domain-containing protein
MIENYLRQLTTVRSRITAGSLTLIILFALSIPLIITNNSYLSDRFQEITEVEVRVDRLLLQASAKVAASRTNLSRYIQGFVSDADAALEDIAETTALLEQAATLPINSERQEEIEGLLAELDEYDGLVREIETSRQSEEGQMVQLEVRALQLGSDLGVRVDQMIQESEQRVETANETIFAESQTRLVILLIICVIILILSFILARSIQRSITRPIADLQAAAEQFRRGEWETAVPVSGNDELTLLAVTFNQMATDLTESQIFLEQRVAQRTQSLETSAEISHNLSSILDQDAFSIAVVEQLQATFGYYYVQLYLANSTNDVFSLKSATGLPGQKMLIRGHQLKKGQGIIGQAAASKEVVVAPDVSKNPFWLSNPLLPDTKSEAAVPIISRDVVFGVLDIQHNILNGINQEEVTLLKSISDQVAIALENARLFERIQQQASHEALLNQITQQIQLASSVDQVLQITAQELGKVLNAELTSVQLGKDRRPDNGHEKVK